MKKLLLIGPVAACRDYSNDFLKLDLSEINCIRSAIEELPNEVITIRTPHSRLLEVVELADLHELRFMTIDDSVIKVDNSSSKSTVWVDEVIPYVNKLKELKKTHNLDVHSYNCYSFSLDTLIATNGTYYELPEYMNHSPQQQGEWIEYNNNRYKDVYDLKLKDGTILSDMYPNGTGWYYVGNDKSESDTVRKNVNDSDVIMVRLTVETDNYPRFNYRGLPRKYRNYNSFCKLKLKVKSNGFV